MNKFTLGMAAGMGTLTLAVPLVAQLSFAATTDDQSFSVANRPVPTQECLLAMVDLEDARLSEFDTRIAEQKTRIQERRDALELVAEITDEDGREEALKQMRDDMQVNREMHEPSAEVQAAMEAVRTACGNTFGMGHGPRGGGEGRHEMLAEKLGLSEEELEAALESGMTIPEIAEEQGVELPAKPEGMQQGRRNGFGGHRGGPGGF